MQVKLFLQGLHRATVQQALALCSVIFLLLYFSEPQVPHLLNRVNIAWPAGWCVVLSARWHLAYKTQQALWLRVLWMCVERQARAGSTLFPGLWCGSEKEPLKCLPEDNCPHPGLLQWRPTPMSSGLLSETFSFSLGGGACS